MIIRRIEKCITGTICALLFLALVGVQPAPDIRGKVVCFGDSITNGALVDGQSWVYYLSQSHPEVNFVEAGENGRKTSDKKEILPVLEQHPEADHFLIFLGVNDLKDGTPAMVDRCVKNMRWMIHQIKQANLQTEITILAPTDINLKTMAPINVRKKYNRHTKRSLAQLKKRYRQLAEEESVQFWSLLDVVSPPNYVDGLHPDTTGQKQIAHSVWKGLQKRYSSL